MVARSLFCSIICGALAAAYAAPAEAAPAIARSVQVRSGPLAEALKALTRQTGAELLYDRRIVQGARASEVRGTMLPEQALSRLLSGTGVAYRRTPDGVFVLFAQPVAVTTAQEPPIPEILVIGVRTQNADIRRTQNDVQPYVVSTASDIKNAHRDNLEQYFTSRITANTEIVPPTLEERAETNSAIDLRGVGAEATLVLVDGRRMPTLPRSAGGVGQADVNAIPLHEIERVEVLTGTAGGIYGFGAIGGVVNVVLKRKYRGLDLHAITGITTRGDARRSVLEARLGFTPDHGRTDVMLVASRNSSQPLLVGQRDYRLRDRLAMGTESSLLHPRGNSLNVISGQPLVLKPEFGGTQLGSTRTYLTGGFEGDSAALAAELAANAGMLDASLAKGEAANFLASAPETRALLANLRHRFGGTLEGYLDAMILTNRGHYFQATSSGVMALSPGSSANPFQQFVFVTFPIENADLDRRVSLRTNRFTAGLSTSLPFGWRASAEASLGSVVRDQETRNDFRSGPFIFPLPSRPVRPFADWNSFQAAAADYRGKESSKERFRTRFSDQAIRAAGPLLGRGDHAAATLSLLVERRFERVPERVFSQMREVLGTKSTIVNRRAGQHDKTISASAELRSRPFAHCRCGEVLKSLDLQLVVRYDRQSFNFATDNLDGEGDRQRVTFAGTAYTAGAKISPASWLLLRGSIATGSLPPTIDSLIDREFTLGDSPSPLGFDPRRGGQALGADGPYLYRFGGSPALKSISGKTLSIGGVLAPFGERSLRLTLDYSRIHRKGDPLELWPEIVLAREEQWPERVTRAPLTAEDQARGFTTGRVTVLDTRAINGSTIRVDAFDARLDWPTRFVGGDIRFYADATYHARNVKKERFGDAVERAGKLDGPLKWRATAGVEWTSGPLTIGANYQYYGKYRILAAGQSKIDNDALVVQQGSSRVPSQGYLDLHAQRHLKFGQGRRSAPDLTLSLAVVNVFDHEPPRESSVNFTAPGYSRYGDPRRRRIEVSLDAQF